MTQKSNNPFGVQDVPDPSGPDVLEFAATAVLDGLSSDANAPQWTTSVSEPLDTLAGSWSSRWNGGADPTIPNDAKEKWKPGNATVKIEKQRVYILFDWHDGQRKGLIDAQREGQRLVGRYINLSNPAIVREWIGLMVDSRRIDGRFNEGRLDFRR